MKISEARQIPHQRLRAFFRFWNSQRGGRRWPRRAEVTLDMLRGAAANTAFCRIERPYRGLDSLRFSNVGTAIEKATRQHLTGMTVAQLLRACGSSPEFTYCFSEYGQVASEGGCTYNGGYFPWPGQNWLAYRRLVMALGDDAEPDALFVVVDLNAEGLGLPLPDPLRVFDGVEGAPAQPWTEPSLRRQR